MNQGPQNGAQRPLSGMIEHDSMFDKRSILIGIGLAALVLTTATVWKVAYHDHSKKLDKIKDMVFEPKEPPKEKVEVKPPQQTLIRQELPDRPEMTEKEAETPNIQMTTVIKDVAAPEEVVKSTTMDVQDVKIDFEKLDIKEPMDKADETAAVKEEALTPIAVLTEAAADIYAYKEPNPTAKADAGLFSKAPRPGSKTTVKLGAIGPQNADTIGELGPMDINLFGTGNSLSGMKRAGFETQTAVDAALRWLALHQEPDGHWDARRWDAESAPFDSSNATAKATASIQKNDGAATALATLALMGGGNTLRKGEYRDNVRRAVQHLIGVQNTKTGFFSENMYEHAIATIAICEAFGRAPDEKVGLAARKAVDACVSSPGKDGGWRYAPNPPSSDISVTSWFLQALKTAKLSNIKFDHAVFSRGVTYLDQVTHNGAMGNSSGAVGYEYNPSLDYGNETPALTCAGMVIRQFNGMGVNHPLLKSAAEITKTKPPAWKEKDFYRWYYATYAMHNMGGEYRLWWNSLMRELLLNNQSKQGHQKGSWNPEREKWMQSRVMTTSIGALCLEVYYRYGEALQSFGTVPELDELIFQ
jgi:hypothetical protein